MMFWETVVETFAPEQLKEGTGRRKETSRFDEREEIPRAFKSSLVIAEDNEAVIKILSKELSLAIPLWMRKPIDADWKLIPWFQRLQ